MATVKLKSRPRTSVGKQGAKHARAEGLIPAILYGENRENVPISIDAREFRVALSTPSGRNVIILLGVDGDEKAVRTVIRAMDRDSVSREIVHVDLQRISEDKPVVMQIPVVVVGESPAVKEGRGILDHTMREVEVRCLPRDIPEHITVDVTGLEVKHAIHVGDLKLPNVEILDNAERPVVEVLQPTIYKEPVAPVAAAALAGEEGEEAGEAGEKAEGGAAEPEPKGKEPKGKE
jgi:large subunit ribosomal protein L25